MSKRAGPLASQEINDAIGDASIDREDAWVRGVMSEHAPAISGLLRCRYPVFNAEDIEDVVIIAMARLWKARDRFDAKKASLKTFLFRIADNVARDVVKSGWYRARSREVWLDETRPDETRLDENGTHRDQPEEAAAETQDAAVPTELQLELREILDRLPDAYRTIVLADASARGRVASAEFLAQELQIPKGAVRVYRHRAMKAIRTALEQAGHKLP